MEGGAGECVKVVIRCRPLSGQEKEDGREPVVKMHLESRQVQIFKPGSGMRDGRDFTFDAVYDASAKQENIYKETASMITESGMMGYNGTIFAYGQTGTGKTHTMVGLENDVGIIPRCFSHIFSEIDEGKSGTKHLVRVSYLEIYQEDIRDLLSKSPKEKLELKEDPDIGTYVKDLSKFVVTSVKEMEQVMAAGTRNRSVGCTLMNTESSRSHSLFMITIETCDDQQRIRAGKLNLVDLAGSERQAKTGATNERLKEATKINLSLSALGNVISALVDGKTNFIPYRDSKLTRLLQDSLGGNTRTVMIANIGPADYNYDETSSTLRYAHRAKSIKNRPRINEDPKDAMIRAFEEEIAQLRAQLAGEGGAMGDFGDFMLDADAEVVEREEEVLREVEVVKEVYKGRTQEDVKMMEERMERERVEAEERFKSEREAIMRQTHLAQEAKETLMKEIREKEDEQAHLRARQAPLLEKLKQMEEKMMQGRNVVTKAMEQEQVLLAAQQELERRRKEEEEAKDRLENVEDQMRDLNDRCATKEELVQKLTRKLETLWKKYQGYKNELEDVQSENQQERNELVDTVRELTKELRLKVATINHFIPSKEYAQIEERATFDEAVDEWHIPKVMLAGNSIAKGKGPPGPREEQPQPREDLQNQTPNVYFTFTAEGPVRAETQPRRRKQSARPGTASRKGRTLRTVDTDDQDLVEDREQGGWRYWG